MFSCLFLTEAFFKTLSLSGLLGLKDGTDFPLFWTSGLNFYLFNLYFPATFFDVRRTLQFSTFQKANSSSHITDHKTYTKWIMLFVFQTSKKSREKLRLFKMPPPNKSSWPGHAQCLELRSSKQHRLQESN